MSTPLTIYKASAGSGKTFRLTVEYISLLIQNPENYRHILAVTFTNKATAEMKMRILSQLYGISKGLESSDGYLKQVRKNVYFKEAELIGRTKDDVIRERAGIALSLLTHHYSDFRVQTIDTFFQTVLRNLARELELTPNMRLSLNDDEIESEAVDNMIEELHPNSKLLKWIDEFIQSKIDENKKWRVMNEIKSFGNNIFKEFYQNHRVELNKALSAPDFFDRFVKTLRTHIATSVQAIVRPYQAMLDVIVAAGLDDTQWYAGSAASCDLTYIKKMAALPLPVPSGMIAPLIAETGSARTKRIEDPKKWASGKNKKAPECQQLVELADAQLCAMMLEAEENRLKHVPVFLSAQMTLVHLNQLRLLRAIEQAVEDMNKDEGRFLLSNTQNLLHSMIDGSDTPFIFEKIGAQLRHIMIDEFQDTSTVQWQNFKVLLDNCLAQQGCHSLIVGDVKQSIYRWRSGDWKLLNNMHDQEGVVKVVPIKENWRSSKDIVAFNNAFFLSAKNKEYEALDGLGIGQAGQLKDAYKDKDTKQDAQKTFPGHVEVRLFKNPPRGSEDAPDATQCQLDSIAERVCLLLEHGVATSDIAILARGKKDILRIADFFAHNEALQSVGARLVSDEAFRLDASLSVRMIICAMRIISHPGDRLPIAELTKNYNTYVLRNQLSESELLIGENQMEKHLPEAFIGRLSQLAMMPLIDLIDHLYELFSLERLEGQTAYVCAFHDKLAQYLDEHSVSIDDVISYWDDKLHEEKVQADDIDGIRIMTIHKSKGLEFHHVIIPFCDWAMEQGEVLWCDKPHPAPYDALPIVPIMFSANMLKTVYAEDYKEEHFQNVVDNLNVLYVAFTRAERTLLVLGRRSKDDKKPEVGKSARSYLLENVLESLTSPKDAKKEEEIKLDGSTFLKDEAGIVFEYGDLDQAIMAAEEEKATDAEAPDTPSENVFELKPDTQHIAVETFTPSAEFRQSNRSRDFASGEGDSSKYIRRGSLLHEIFSHIRTLDDVEPMIAQLTLDGIVAGDEDSLADLRTQIAQCLRQEEAREWFSPRWTLFNECTILTTDPGTGRTVEHRPDRVMKDGDETIVVDFKFGHPRPEYKEQVSQYANLLSEMGERNVRSYLWYVTEGHVERVS